MAALLYIRQSSLAGFGVDPAVWSKVACYFLLVVVLGLVCSLLGIETARLAIRFEQTMSSGPKTLPNLVERRRIAFEAGQRAGGQPLQNAVRFTVPTADPELRSDVRSDGLAGRFATLGEATRPAPSLALDLDRAESLNSQPLKRLVALLPRSQPRPLRGRLNKYPLPRTSSRVAHLDAGTILYRNFAGLAGALH